MTLEETVDKAIHSGADAIFRWLQSPGCRGSFDQAVAEHLVWFQAARVRGMGWSAIVNVLSHAGVKRDSGLRLSEGHVRGVVSRQQKKVKKDENDPLQRLVARYGSSPPAAKDRGSRSQLKHAPSKTLAFGLNHALQALPPQKCSEPSGKTRRTQMDGQSGIKKLSTNTPDRGNIRAFMQKAAALRRCSGKD
jgi:hypothetical protein